MSETDEREARIRELLPLVKRIARRLKRLAPGFDLDDLIGDGSLGLIRAVDSYDPSRGSSLKHFARHSIAGAMLNGIRRMDPVSERARRAVRDCENDRYAIAAERGDVPTLAEMDRRHPSYARASLAARRSPSTRRCLQARDSLWIGTATRRARSSLSANTLRCALRSRACRYVSARSWCCTTTGNTRCAQLGAAWRFPRSAPRNCTSPRWFAYAGRAMLQRVEPEESYGLASAAEAYADPIVPAAAGTELGSDSLPPEHPRWVKDSLAVSQRARALVARLRPIAIRILTFWDHRIRSAFVGGLQVRIDPSGCYRLDD
jgi:RNA polymerase sigma factor (sigma-70 family)